MMTAEEKVNSHQSDREDWWGGLHRELKDGAR